MGTELQRWKTGHRVFHAYLVTMVTLLGEGARELPDAAEDRIARVLVDLARLYVASTASMKYASSFTAAAYEQIVRPSMMPPFTRPGFSGVLNVDHRRMLDGLDTLAEALAQRFGPAADGWPVAVAEAWRELQGARRESHRHHGLICRRFVNNGPSLLRAHRLERQ
jgi:hypothetical protein